MRFEIENGAYVGAAEWQGPGRVTLEVTDPHEREFFERYFASEYQALGGTVDCPQLQVERPDASEETFERAMNRLSTHDYEVRRADAGRSGDDVIGRGG